MDQANCGPLPARPGSDPSNAVAAWMAHVQGRTTNPPDAIVSNVKTTIDIPEGLLSQARKLAASTNITLETLIELALRDKIQQSQLRAKDFELAMVTVEGKGLQPGLSWDNWSEIRDLSYEGRGGKS